jgi:hypothetical protein
MGDTQYKAIMGDVAIKSESKGEVEAVFARLNVIDHDGDVTVPGAFKEGQTVAISQHGHTIWDGTAPVGKGTIHTVGDTAVFRGKFFMDMQAARDTFHAVKGMAEHGQWSYGFNTLTAEPGQLGGKDVKFLKELEVFEVSPVLRGAGIGTSTLSAKQHKTNDGKVGTVAALWSPIKTHETAVTAKRWTPPSAPEVAALGIPELRAKHAAVRLDMDPEDPAAYWLDHHDANGAANVMQCVKGIALLNGARNGPGFPDDVAKAVYDHLADHLKDADRDPPTFLKAAEGKFTFYEQAAVTLADIDTLLDRADEVVRLRADRQHQKFASKRAEKAAQAAALPPVSTEMLEWILDSMRRAKSLIDTPAEDLERERLRFMREQFLRDNPPAGE